MISSTALLVALGLQGVALPVADFDIPYFQANPEIRGETLRRCRDDYRLAQTSECMNAEEAANRAFHNSLSGRSKSRPTKKPAAPRQVPAIEKKVEDRAA